MEDLEHYAIFEFDDMGIPFRVTIHHTLRTGDLYSTIVNQGIESARKQYDRLRKNKVEFTESELNSLGYQLLGIKNIKAAIEIFKLNVEAYPASFNVYDSLGEAYLANGDDKLAIENYRKSLELNPQNLNAVRIIKEIEEK